MPTNLRRIRLSTRRTGINARIMGWMAVLLCASGVASSQETALVRGEELLAPLKKELKLALMAGIQKDPVNAISVCKEQAPAIADSLAVNGVQLGRTSHRLRNPANIAPEWVDPILRKYLDKESDRVPRVVYWVEYPMPIAVTEE